MTVERSIVWSPICGGIRTVNLNIIQHRLLSLQSVLGGSHYPHPTDSDRGGIISSITIFKEVKMRYTASSPYSKARRRAVGSSRVRQTAYTKVPTAPSPQKSSTSDGHVAITRTMHRNLWVTCSKYVMPTQHIHLVLNSAHPATNFLCFTLLAF